MVEWLFLVVYVIFICARTPAYGIIFITIVIQFVNIISWCIACRDRWSYIWQEIASRLTFGEAKHCNNGAGEVIRETLSLSLSRDLKSSFCFDQTLDKSPLHPFLLCVSDLLLLGRATIEESRSLLIHWLDTEEGFGKMGVCGRVVWVSHETNLWTIACHIKWLTDLFFAFTETWKNVNGGVQHFPTYLHTLQLLRSY